MVLGDHEGEETDETGELLGLGRGDPRGRQDGDRLGALGQGPCLGSGRAEQITKKEMIWNSVLKQQI